MPDKLDDPVTKIERSLRHVAFIIKKRGRDILVDFGITSPQFGALLALRENPNITMGELCDKLFLACSTATDLVDRMEKNGFLERKRDAQDRRVIRLSISDMGKRVISEVVAARRRYVSSILEKLTDEEISQLAQSLDRLHSLMFQEKVTS
ncbi:MAG: MarR family winged helix-turn-helix transcriptional regulator [Bacillota bacterium]|jgi:DNA-binding MarR family transcriptional regulator|nr:MarR family transcriptional regulator [Candidatus Fermentithermobacillaceae bacterium]